MTRTAGRWPVLLLTLSLLTGPAAAASLFGADSPLPTAEARMQALITELSSPRYGGRLAGSPGDALTRRLIQAEFRALGLQPAGEDGDLQWFETRIASPSPEDEATGERSPQHGRRVRSANIAAWLPGQDARLARELIIISAHHDHLGPTASGQAYYPGANDNASGVAALLELARGFAARRDNRRSLLFIAYGAEEQPFMGSMHHAAQPLPVERGRELILMSTVDMIGQGFGAWLRYSAAQRCGFVQRWLSALQQPAAGHADDYSHEYQARDDEDSYDFDAGPFAARGVRNRVFGRVEDVPHYHRSSDTAAQVELRPALRFLGSVEDFLRTVDRDGLSPAQPGARPLCRE